MAGRGYAAPALFSPSPGIRYPSPADEAAGQGRFMIFPPFTTVSTCASAVMS